jgi:hypothetical protein
VKWFNPDVKRGEERDVAVSTITYAVNGKQYVAIITGNGLLDGSLLNETPELKPPRGENAIYAFALP